jgi:hypothetical protein
MRRTTLTPLLVCLAAVLVTACQDEEGYECTASFYTEQGGELISTAEYTYDDADDADEAAALCQDEADADQPEGSRYFACHCESQ